MHIPLHKVYEDLTAGMSDFSKALMVHIKNGLPTPQTHQVTRHIALGMSELQAASQKLAAVMLDLEEQHQQNEFEKDKEQKQYLTDTPDPCIFSNPSDAKVVEDVR